jgi:hypothetical protein
MFHKLQIAYNVLAGGQKTRMADLGKTAAAMVLIKYTQFFVYLK